MSKLHEIKLMDVMPELPDINRFDAVRDLAARSDQLFMCALGFEDRAVCIPEQASEATDFRVSQAIYFEYSTNRADNEINRIRLESALQSYSGSIQSLQCDEDGFASKLRSALRSTCTAKDTPSIVFDISACSSGLLLLALKVLFEFDVSLRIVYSEAAVYHPTQEEYEDEPQKWIAEEGFGLAKGVGRVVPSSEHPGHRRDLLPEAVIVFPTFKPERTKAVVTYVDQALITKPGDRLIWIVGVPHLSEDSWRVDMMVDVNKIPKSAPLYKMTTFDYKKTLDVLERIYGPRDRTYHITVSPLGAKMQSLGLALFWYMRQDVSIVFAVPKEYNARQYSEGCKDTWQVDFGNLKLTRDVLDRVGQLQIVD